MSFWPREILSCYLSRTSRATKEPLNEKLPSSGEMCLCWMQKVQKEGHPPASHFSRPESRACVDLEILNLSLWLKFLSQYRKSIRPGLQPWETAAWILTEPFGKGCCYPRALQCLHQDPQDLDLSSAGDWKVLKALAKAMFSKLPNVNLQPSGLLDSQAVAASLRSHSEAGCFWAKPREQREGRVPLNRVGESHLVCQEFVKPLHVSGEIFCIQQIAIFQQKSVLLKCFQPSWVTSESECVELSWCQCALITCSSISKEQMYVFASLFAGSSLECCCQDLKFICEAIAKRFFNSPAAIMLGSVVLSL